MDKELENISYEIEARFVERLILICIAILTLSIPLVLEYAPVIRALPEDTKNAARCGLIAIMIAGGFLIFSFAWYPVHLRSMTITKKTIAFASYAHMATLFLGLCTFFYGLIKLAKLALEFFQT